jgi:hypothetical protein
MLAITSVRPSCSTVTMMIIQVCGPELPLGQRWKISGPVVGEGGLRPHVQLEQQLPEGSSELSVPDDV